jgi:spore photoproduct lyase
MITANLNDRAQVTHQNHPGEFWKPCPGTGQDYCCCGYQILTPLTGCGMYCSYCVLQVYFDHQHQTVFDNFTDLEKEVTDKLSRWNGVVRFGTGEFGDSLFLENQFSLSKKIADLLEPYPNAIVEFKTKSVHVGTLDAIKNKKKVIISFSMNTPRMISLLEQNTASLEDRLAAAALSEKMGFWVSFHFDPMIHYDGWEQEYRAVIDRIYSSIKDSNRIAWISLGGFRTIPSLKKLLMQRHQHLPLFSGEMITGMDGKYRYFRPVRVGFYRAMVDQIGKHNPNATVYLCMESLDVWEEAGMIERIPNGLASYLDNRANILLGIV